MSPEVHIWTFSGGKDSTAMLLKGVEHGYKMDYVVFVKTGVEYPETLEAVAKMEAERLAPLGLKITYLEPERTFKDLALNKFKGFPSFSARWCIRELKLKPLAKFRRELRERHPGALFIEYIGYSLDERDRAERLKKTGETKQRRYKFPLIEDFKLSERGALSYCYESGFNFNGIYERLPRLGCYICPFQRDREALYLIRERPELWEDIEAMERDLKAAGSELWRFKRDHSTADYNRRYKGLRSIEEFK